MKYLLLTILLALGCGLASFAQPTPLAPTGPFSGPFPKGNQAPVANFTGVVYVSTLVKDDPTFTLRLRRAPARIGTPTRRARYYW
jgi:hypothetical protein